MRLHIRLGLLFGGLLLLAVLAVAVIFYREVRLTFMYRSAQQAAFLAESAVDQGERRSKILSKALGELSDNIQIGILMRDAPKSGAAQRRLIDLMSDRMPAYGLQELTAIASDGVILARGHRPTEFGDRADSAPAPLYLTAGSTVLRLRRPVQLQGRAVGEIEGGLDLADFLSEMGKLFSGQVILLDPSAAQPVPSAAGPFEFVMTNPWKTADGAVLAHLVFSKTDEQGRDIFRRLMGRLALAIFFIVILALVLVFRLSDTVTRLLRQLAEAAVEISRGNRQLSLPPPTRDEVGALTEAFRRMVSSLDESQKKLLAAERLAAWQDAARMLAHEIKNPLSPIKITATTLSRAAQENDPNLPGLAARGAGTILNEIGQLEKLLSEFSSFARFPSPQPVPADFNAGVRAAIEPFKEKAKDIRWIEHYAAGLPHVMIDSGMFSEVVRNLVLNALDAMDSKSAGHPGRVICVETFLEHGHVGMTLADSGPGIPVEKHRTLFTPYFTTKAGGTGLGLAVSRKIMIEHGGDLFLLDESPFPAACGAAFRAKLPVAGTHP